MPVIGTLNYKVNGAPTKLRIGGGEQINLPDLIHKSQILNLQDILTGKYTLISSEIVKQPVIENKIEDFMIEEDSALKKAKKEAKIYISENAEIKSKKLNKKKIK